MKADLSEQWKLLDLQKLDTRLTQLAHKRNNLPQTDQIAKVREDTQKLHEEVVLAQTALQDTDREVTRAENDVEMVRQRAKRDTERLEAGQGSAKELVNLQHELKTLERRQAELEDAELEIMERREKMQADLEAKVAKHEALDAEIEKLEVERESALSQIEADEREAELEREKAAAKVKPELLDFYEKLRGQFGIAAAPLVERRCGGCGLELNAGDLARIKAASHDEVLRCEECRRILVRTSESGL